MDFNLSPRSNSSHIAMHVFRGLPSPLQRIPSAVAIGNFDGVHTGHQALLAGLVEAARERGLVPSVLTFEPHPREFFPHLDPVPRISTLCDKVKRLLDCGIERIYMMPFNEHIAREGAEAFVTNVLVNGLDARWVTEYRTDSAGKPCSSGARRSLCRQSFRLGPGRTVRRRLFGTSSYSIECSSLASRNPCLRLEGGCLRPPCHGSLHRANTRRKEIQRLGRTPGCHSG